MTPAELENLPPHVRKALDEKEAKCLLLEAEKNRLERVVSLLQEQIRLDRLAKYGPKADKLCDGQLILLPSEIVVTQAELDREAELPEPAKRIPTPKKPRAAHPGRTELPAHLERREVVIPCKPEDCRCHRCGGERPVIGYEVREELDCEPAHYFVKVIKREKRGTHCQPGQGVVVAAAPERIMPKSKLSDAFIIEAIAAKFQQHLPVYRQCAQLWEDHQIDLSRGTLNMAIIRALDLLVPVTKAMAKELLSGNYLQVDETKLPCQSPESKGKNHPAYLWEYSEPGGTVVFQFENGRGRAGPQAFLEGFQGIIQCDGYVVYDKLGPGITYQACMAHIRRKFVEANKLAPEDPRPVELVEKIAELYQIESSARKSKLSEAERLALRQSQSRPLMGALKKRIEQVRQEVTPASKLAQACDYATGQWTRMEVYLEHGQVEIDNNWCEGAFRPVVLGRKNWLHVGSMDVGPKIAAIMSIVETCRRLDLPLRTYLRDVLAQLSRCTMSQVPSLTPKAWKASHPAHTTDKLAILPA